jgi:hypothetical protein
MAVVAFVIGIYNDDTAITLVGAVVALAGHRRAAERKPHRRVMVRRTLDVSSNRAGSIRPTRSSGPRADPTDCSQSAPRRSRRRRICPTRDRTVRADTFPELYERGDNDALLDSLHDLEADPVMRGWLVST